MYKRQNNNSSSSKYTSLADDSKSKRIRKHPIQQVISTLPQLAISFAILFFSLTHIDSSKSDFRGFLFYVSLLAGIVICSVFVVLQVQGAEYKNWQQDPKTRQYIQIASISSVVAFLGFNTSLWPIYGILTPMVIGSGFVFVLSVLIMFTAFL